MAWTDQCKFAFKASAEALLLKQRGRRSLKKIFRELSQDTGIPLKTLERWWAEIQRLKNEANLEVNEIVTNQEVENGDQGDRSLCLECGQNPVFLTRHGKPFGITSSNYGLCNSCRCKKARIKKKQRTENASTILHVVCPGCGLMFDINADNLKVGGENE